jgi:hypothetical protein
MDDEGPVNYGQWPLEQEERAMNHLRLHVELGERRAAGDIAPIIMGLLARRALLRSDGPRAQGTANTVASGVVEDADPRLRDRGRQLLLDGVAVAEGRRRRPANAGVLAVCRR